MRLVQPIEVSGTFWLPSEPANKLPGTLSIEDGGEIHLEVLGFFETLVDAISGKNIETPRIIGSVERFGFVTLDQCFYERRTISFPAPSKNRIHVSFAFLGVAYEADELITFNCFKFSVEGLDEWHSISGINVEHNLQANTAIVTYKAPTELILLATSAFRIWIQFAWTFPSRPAIKEAKISQQSYLNLEFANATTLYDFCILAHKLIHFFSFAIGKLVSIRELTATSPDLVEQISPLGKERKVPVPIYYQSLSHSDLPPTIERHNMLFPLDTLGGSHQSIISRWIETHEKTTPALNLYFSATGDAHKYLNSRFLLLAQTLETYHRRTSQETQMPDSEFQLLKWAIVEATAPPYREFIQNKLAYANEMSLAKRLKHMLSRFECYFGNESDKKKLVRHIVDTRNYFTHYDPSLTEKAAEGVSLWHLCISMEALFQLLIMSDIGISSDTIGSICEGNYSLRRALKPNQH